MRRLLRNKSLAYTLIFCLIGSLAAPTIASAFESETRVLLCTSQGYQWVTISDEQSSSFNSVESQHCLFCISSDDDQENQFHHFKNYLADLSPIAAFRYFPRQKLQAIVSNAQARAPPVYI